MKINILGRTGPRSLKGKQIASMNALKHGGYSPRLVLDFEDAAERKRVERKLYRDLKPQDCVEETLVDQMVQSLWLMERFKLRLSLRQESIFENLTPATMAQMLEIPEPYCAYPPDYLKEPSTKFSKKEVTLASERFTKYQHLQTHAKGIANYQMVFGAYHDLFVGLDGFVGDSYDVPILAATGQGLSIAWQNEPKKMEEVLVEYAAHLYYQIHFEELRPLIRGWMSAWFFIQRRDRSDKDIQDEQIMKELNRYQATLGQLVKYRKARTESRTPTAHEDATEKRNEIPNSDSKSGT